MLLFCAIKSIGSTAVSVKSIGKNKALNFNDFASYIRKNCPITLPIINNNLHKGLKKIILQSCGSITLGISKWGNNT